MWTDEQVWVCGRKSAAEDGTEQEGPGENRTEKEWGLTREVLALQISLHSSSIHLCVCVCARALAGTAGYSCVWFLEKTGCFFVDCFRWPWTQQWLRVWGTGHTLIQGTPPPPRDVPVPVPVPYSIQIEQIMYRVSQNSLYTGEINTF